MTRLLQIALGIGALIYIVAVILSAIVSEILQLSEP